MHATLRYYTGAPGFVDALVENEGEVKRIITGIDGFQAYYLVRSGDTAISVSVYDDKAGADASNEAAAAWVRENLPDLKVEAPNIAEGEVAISL